MRPPHLITPASTPRSAAPILGAQRADLPRDQRQIDDVELCSHQARHFQPGAGEIGDCHVERPVGVFRRGDLADFHARGKTVLHP